MKLGRFLMVLVLSAWLPACGGSERQLEDGGTDGDSDVDGDADADADDAGPDGDADAGADADTDAELDADLSGPVDPYADGELGAAEESARIGLGGWPIPDNLDLHIYVPEERAGAPFPVVIYSHGFQLTAGQYASTGRRLASHGIVAVLPNYGDNLLDSLSHSVLADRVIRVVDWVHEQAADEASSLHGVVDPTRIAAGGHSRGGKQSMLAAIRDDRILASFDIDPVDVCHPIFGCSDDNPSVTPELMSGYTVPSGFVGAGRSSAAPMGQPCAPEAQNYHAYFVESPSPAFEYFLPEAGHLDFPDGCGMICSTCRAGDEPEWNRNFALATMVAFYRVYLADDARYQPWVDGEPVHALAERVTFDSH